MYVRDERILYQYRSLRQRAIAASPRPASSAAHDLAPSGIAWVIANKVSCSPKIHVLLHTSNKCSLYPSRKVAVLHLHHCPMMTCHSALTAGAATCPRLCMTWHTHGQRCTKLISCAFRVQPTDVMTHSQRSVVGMDETCASAKSPSTRRAKDIALG